MLFVSMSHYSNGKRSKRTPRTQASDGFVIPVYSQASLTLLSCVGPSVNQTLLTETLLSVILLSSFLISFTELHRGACSILK